MTTTDLWKTNTNTYSRLFDFPTKKGSNLNQQINNLQNISNTKRSGKDWQCKQFLLSINGSFIVGICLTVKSKVIFTCGKYHWIHRHIGHQDTCYLKCKKQTNMMNIDVCEIPQSLG